MDRLLILADDITGAADCLSYCASLNVPSWVVQGQQVQPLPSGIIAVNTDSRHLSQEAARGRVEETFSALSCDLTSFVFKKIDSVFRGNIGAELEAMLSVQGPGQFSMVCPALPRYGRGMENGEIIWKELDGGRIDCTSLIRRQTSLPLGEVRLAALDLGDDSLKREVLASVQTGARIVLIDALTEQHVERIARVGLSLGARGTLAGSAALLGALAPLLRLRGGRQAVAAARGGALFAIGSGASVSHAQLRRLRDERRVVEITLEPMEIISVPFPARPPDGPLLIHYPPPEPGTILEGAAARSAIARLARYAAKAIEVFDPGSLLLSGGDTAQLVLDELQIRQLQLIGTLLPGMPLLLGSSPAGTSWRFVLKSGSQGDEDALVRIVDTLAREAPER